MRTSESRSGRRWALVLSGGDGTRLQALTHAIAGAPIPKQYCRLLGSRSLLETTLDRAERFAPLERVMVVMNRDHLTVGASQLRRLPPGNVAVQPCNRDTGPGVLFSLLHLERRDPNATVAVLPSDHYVGDDRAFMRYVEGAAALVDSFPDKIALLGIRPDRPESGFGYIIPGAPLRNSPVCGAAEVLEFLEKPSTEAAASLLQAGALWNSFVMVFKLRCMLDLLAHARPRQWDRMRPLSRGLRTQAAVYQGMEAWNFSSDFLSKIPDHLTVVPVQGVHWSDWGTPEAIHRTLLVLHPSAVVPDEVDPDPLPNADAVSIAAMLAAMHNLQRPTALDAL